MTYDSFFAALFDSPEDSRRVLPYGYQRELAVGSWPDMLSIPTGMGKTAAITAAWLYRRLIGDHDTPRRLIWCLPMRVLVEQTRDNVQQWLARAHPFFTERGLETPKVFILMGDEVDREWVENPEQPAMIIGTLDMLLSRALMRGYGMSRYRWPVDFALLHNDALWVFDEVQLMGAGLATSAQLEGFRRNPEMPQVLPSRTIWSSATLNPAWFDTVDFRPYLKDCRIHQLTPEDRADERVKKLIGAPKSLTRATAALAGSKKNDEKAYIQTLCDEVLGAHDGSGPTLVILNQVGRAQDVYRRIRDRLSKEQRPTQVILVHSRFRADDRSKLNARLRAMSASDDVIVVATQAIEAGVDITLRHLFTELAPWPSLVQRFGRCNRGAEYADAVVNWMDIADGDPKTCLPYEASELADARTTLSSLASAASQDLPPVIRPRPVGQVLRRKDLIELFNTEADLSGFDIDVSPYIRDTGGPSVQVFWRTFDLPTGQPRPHGAELCQVPIGATRQHLKATGARAWLWNSLERTWRSIGADDVRPGQTLMFVDDTGGYDAELGFVVESKSPVVPLPARSQGDSASMDDEADAAGPWGRLDEHLVAAESAARLLTEIFALGDAAHAVIRAALWHDVGKAHPAFHTAILENAPDWLDRSQFYAKSPDARRRLTYKVAVGDTVQSRKYFRHELASMLAWLQTGTIADGSDGLSQETIDLIAYLILAHHGKVRMVIRSLPNETVPPDDRLFARGLWDGDELPSVTCTGLKVPAMQLHLDIMRLGDGRMGESWSTRTARLLEYWGPFRLAWLEAMVRIADWRASAPLPEDAAVVSSLSAESGNE